VISLTPLALMLALFQPLPAHAAITLTVNSTADAADADAPGPFDGICDAGAGNCTLRAAIQEANAAAGPDAIHFNISGTAPFDITPDTALPAITGQLTVDGTTQPGYPTPPFTTTPAAPVVVLDGTALSLLTTDGLTLDADADDSEIRGLRIVNVPGAGIHTLEGADGVKIRANQIGTDGTDPLPNGDGILIESDNVAIGANGANDANLISGNGDPSEGSDGGNGIHLGPLSSNADIRGNLIGTDAAGDVAVGNEHNGIHVEGDGHRIGGVGDEDRNVVSGNRTRGIWINGTSATDIAVQGNLIGTNAAGSAALQPLDPGPVQETGIEATVAGTVTIGSAAGGAAEEGNVISGNGVGVAIRGTSDALVSGNLIGTSADGVSAIGNTGSGVLIEAFSTFAANGNEVHGNTIASSSAGVVITSDADVAASSNVVAGNFIGTNAGGDDLGNDGSGVSIQALAGDVTPNMANLIGGVGEGNTIAFNADDGVELQPPTHGDAIRENLIYANGDEVGDLGIDLGADGRTANDADDADTGANGLQNFPVISSATPSNDRIQFSLDSAASTDFAIDFFAASSCPSGLPQAESFLGSTTVATDGTGSTGEVTFDSPVDLVAGEFVTATATDPNGNTSELADCVAVAAEADLEMTVDAPADVVAGQDLEATVSVTNDGPDAASSVEVDITLPVGSDQPSASSTTAGVTCDTATPGSISCTKASLAASSSFDIDVSVRTSTTPGPLTTSAAADSAEADPDGATASADTTATDASPGFAPATSYDLAGDDAHSVVTGDFDEDGDRDVVVTSPGDGTASFLPGSANAQLGAATAITVGGEPRFAVAADFNGDDHLDLVVNVSKCPGNQCNELRFLAGNGNGTFDAAVAISGVANQPKGLAAGDLNDDGDADFVAADNNNAVVTVYLGNGDGTFAATAEGGNADGHYGVALADVDGDRDPDVVATTQTQVKVLRNDGTGDLGPVTPYALTSPTTSTPWPVILDANEDGIRDVAVSGNAELLIGHADGTFDPTVEKLTSPDAFFLADGDFNGDGRADLEAAVDGPALGEADLVQLRGKGTGAFVDGPDAILQYDVTSSLASADLNGDGLTDLIAPNGGDDKVTVLLSNATIAVTGLTISNPATSPAGFSSIDTSTLDFSKISYLEGTLEASAGPMAAPIPAKPIPAKPIPAKPIPAKPIPAKPIPAKPIPAKFFGGGANSEEISPLDGVPLSALLNHPIDEPPSLTMIDVVGGWQAKLSGPGGDADLAKTPLQNLTLNDVILVPAVADTAIEDFDFSHTALGSLPPSAFLYGETHLADIGLPAGTTWASDLLAEMATTVDYPCIGTISQTDETQTLLDLAIARCPIALAPWNEMEVADVTLTAADGPLYGLNFSAIDVSKVPQLAGIELADLPPGIVDCTVTALDCTAGGDTLGSAQQYETSSGNSVFFADATFGPLADADLLGDMTLGDLLLGVIQPDGFPYENVPLDELLAAARPSATGAVTYTVAFTLACPEPAGLQVTANLPNDSFRYVEGTTSVKADNVVVPAASVDPTDDGDGHLTWDLGGVCGTASVDVTVDFKAQPSPTIGSYVARARVETGAGDTFKSQPGPVLALTEPNEPNDVAPGQAKPMQPGFLVPGGFATAGDVDYLKIPVSAADEGSLITVYLSHFAADDDLVAYGSVPTNLASAPIPAKPIPAKSVGDQEGCLPPGYVLQPQTLETVPSVVNSQFAVRGFSTNRSDQEEIVCTTVQPGDVGQGFVLLQITHHAGTTVGDTYLARANVTPPPDLGPCEGPTFANTGQTFGASQYSRTIGISPGSFPAAGDTLFLINEDRFGDLYGLSEEQQTLAKLNELALKPSVDGYILPVENDLGAGGVAGAYAALDADPCSVDGANRVVSEITQLVSTVTGGVMPKYVVIVGGDPIVPFARLQDLTTLGNQVAYAGNLVFDGTSNPTARAMARGMYLSDSPYGTRFAIPWVGNLVYIPDAAVGRLVEEPDDIQDTIQRFLDDADGQLDPKTAFVTGTDSSIPTANAIKQGLQTRATRLNNLDPNADPYSVKTLIDSPTAWTRAQAICRIEGYNRDDCDPTPTDPVDFEPPGIISWNAHFDHHRTLAGNGDVGDLFTTEDFADSVRHDDVVFFTIGCNAGVNVPDIYLSLPTAGGEELDWAQAVDGVFVGNNGFGYGDTTRTAYSERMMQLFAAKLDENITLGQADKLSRGTYWAELGAVSPYDVKSIQQTTFYGLPFWKVTGNAGTTQPGETVVDDPQTGLPSVTQSIPNFVDPVADRHQTSDGEFFTGPRTQVTPGKPIQPLSRALEMTATDEDLQLRGALVTSLKIRDFEHFDPVIARTHLDGAFFFFEPFVASGSFPTDLLNVTSVQGNDFVVLYGGRFTADGTGFGTQRIHLSETVRGLYADKGDPDFAPPTLFGGQGQAIGGGFATFTVHVPDPDAAAAFVLYRPTNSDTFVLKKLAHAGGDLYETTVNVPAGVDEFFFQAVDDSANVGFDTFKGATQELLDEPTPPPGINIEVTSATPPSDGWYSDDVDVTFSSPYFSSFSATVDGGPSSFSFSSPFTVHIPFSGGVHRVDYQTSFGSGVVFVPMDGTPPEITTTIGSPSFGEDPIYVAPTTPITIRVEDPGGVAECSIHVAGPGGFSSDTPCGEGDTPVTLGTADGPYLVTPAATDNAGNETSDEIAFEVVRDGTPPTITNTVPGVPKFIGGGTTFVTSATTLRVTVTDPPAGTLPGSGVKQCTTSIAANGTVAPPAGPAALNPGTCHAGNNDHTIATTTPDGPYRISTSATDNVENASTGSFDVTLDNTPPALGPCPTGLNPGVSATLVTGVSATATTLTVDEQATPPHRTSDGKTVPFDITIDGERMTVTDRVFVRNSEARYTYTVARHVGGTTAAPHAVNAGLRWTLDVRRDLLAMLGTAGVNATQTSIPVTQERFGLPPIPFTVDVGLERMRVMASTATGGVAATSSRRST
jgi:CSLREA domain-containing protein